MERLCGIWLDHEKALIVHFIDGKPLARTLYSEAESHFHFSGGHGSKVPYATQEVASEQRYEAKQCNSKQKSNIS